MLFRQYCATCHGHQGRGDGPASRVLIGRPLDWTLPATLSKRSDEDIRKKILDGSDAKPGERKSMPAFAEELSPADVDALVGYVRQLAAGNASPPPSGR